MGGQLRPLHTDHFHTVKKNQVMMSWSLCFLNKKRKKLRAWFDPGVEVASGQFLYIYQDVSWAL